jgi:VWFA-related protein
MQVPCTVVALSVLLGSSIVLSTAQQDTAPTMHAQSTAVLVPTLVMRKSGEIIHGLTVDDFILEDNGKEQSILLDDMPELESLSLVVAVQRGGSAYLQFERGETQQTQPPDGRPKPHKLRNSLSGLGSMVEEFLGQTDSEVAIVTFDNTVELLQSFTQNVPAVAEKLRDLKGSGKSGAALLDAVNFSVDLLEHEAKKQAKVLLLISEERDHGSIVTADQLVKRVTLSNTLIYSVSFSPVRAEAVRDFKEGNPEPSAGVDFLRIIKLASDAIHKNAAQSVAEMGGGEYSIFKDKGSFDQDLMALTNHVRNRYLLSYQPNTPQPGLHVIKVRLRVPQPDFVVVARNRYWADDAK